ncbi:hypothetical protein BD769DRAFT_1643404, partial [Suillus cothurnatus]
MFILNPILMGLLKDGVVIDCGLINIDNPRIGFDVPFGVRIDIAIEPNNILDFIGLYFNNRSPGEKLQGMVQVECHDTVGTYTGAECHIRQYMVHNRKHQHNSAIHHYIVMFDLVEER